MRIARVLAGTVALLLAMPLLAAGAFGGWTLKHRGPDGTFQAELARITATGRIVVVPDVDALLRRDAPFARGDRTELRLTVEGGGFIGMAAPADLAAYLSGVDHTELVRAQLGLGPLAVQTREVKAAGNVLLPYEKQTFWVRSAARQLRWSPADDRDRQVALIVIAQPGVEPVRLDVALDAGWLGSTTWGLLIIGPMLLLLGLAVLAWPTRRREVVYVVDGEIVAKAAVPARAPIWRHTLKALLPRPAPPPVPERAPDARLSRPPGGPDRATEPALAGAKRGGLSPDKPPLTGGTVSLSPASGNAGSPRVRENHQIGQAS